MAYSMFIFSANLAFLLILSINASSELMKATDSTGRTFSDGLGVVSPNQSLTIHCSHDGNLKWERRDVLNSKVETLKSNDKITVRGNELEIRNIDFSDALVYYCEKGGVAYRFYLHVYAITKSRNGTAPTSKTEHEINGIKFSTYKLADKSSANISCTCDSGVKTTNVNVMWQGKMFSNKVSENFHVITEQDGSAKTSTLVLTKLPNDKRYYGEYKCQCNVVTGAVKESRVSIEVPPIFEDHVSSVRTTEGQTIILNCNVWGYPEITGNITWRFQNNTEMRDGIEIINNQSTTGYSQLVIPMATQADRGVYTCHAKNSVGSNIAGTMVRVKGRYAALWPFIGIVVQVIILAVIIIVYEWKKSHKTQEDNSKFIYDSKNQQDVVVATKSSDVTDVRQRLMKE